MHKLEIGDRVYHRRRHESGIYCGLDTADPSGATVWVKFESGDEEMVSRDLLSKELR